MKRLHAFILVLLIWSGLPALAGEYCLPVIYLAPTVSFCQGNSITLNAFNANATYKWSNGAKTPSITVSTPGTYWVKVTNSCGSTSDTVQVFIDQSLVVNLGLDREVCSSGNPILSVPYSPSFTYLWQDNSTSHQIPITKSGKYYVKITNACGTFSDTVNITLHDPANLNLGPDINYCTPGSHTLSVPASTVGVVKWSTGQSSKSISVTKGGVYWVKVTNACGVHRDTVRITFEQGKYLDIGDTIAKCSLTPATITANVYAGTYLWSTSAVSRSISVSSPGLYWVKYTDNCGAYYDSVYVISQGAPVVDLGNDTAICYGDEIVLDAGNPGSSYLWHAGGLTQKFTVDTTGLYIVDVNNGCGVTRDSIWVDAILPPVDSIGDSVFYCIGSFEDVNAGYFGPNSSYVWDDASTGRYNQYSSDGAHWVEVSNECDTVLVNFYVKGINPTPFDLGPDTVVCDSITLRSGLSESRCEFEWRWGGEGPNRVAYQSGVYWLKVSNVCGDFYDTVNVVVLHKPWIWAPSGRVICNGLPVPLMALPNSHTDYQWNTGDTSHTIMADTAGLYIVTAWNECDSITDSVYVREEEDIVFSLGNDTIICEPDTVFLDVSGLPADSIRWKNGYVGWVVPVTTSGTYWVTLYNGCGAFSDTIKIEVRPEPGGKVADQAICIGDSVLLDAYRPFITGYYWSTGATTSSITVNTSGTYWVNLLSDCGWVTDTIVVRVDGPVPPFSLGKDTVFCKGTLWLNAGYLPGATYLWNDGTKSSSKLVTRSGTYYVTKSNACNSESDTITVLITGPPIEILGDTVRFCTGSTFTLNAQNPGSTYLWNDSTTGQFLSSDTTGKYWVTIENPCGKLTDTVILVADRYLDSLELGNDTIICRGQTLPLSTGYPGPGITTVWATGASSHTINVDTTGKYWVSITNTCGTWTDTIFVLVLDVPVFSLGPDSVICAIDGRVDLYGPSGDLTYKWSTGETSRNITATKAGWYWLEVDNTCFTYVDSIFLKEEYPIEMNLGNDTVLCFGQSLFLSPGNVGYPLRWNGNFNGLTKEVTRSGRHWVSAKNSCGVFSDTIEVWFDMPVDPYPIDTIVCGGDSAILDLTNQRFEVSWFDGKTDLKRGFTEEGIYGLFLTNTCGSFPKDFVVNVENCDCPIYVPSAFTPNGDGVNDEFLVGYDCSVVSFEITIFDRWGKIQYQSKDGDFFWDGTSKGKQVSMGTLHYMIDYTWLVYGQERKERKRGVVTIIR